MYIIYTARQNNSGSVTCLGIHILYFRLKQVTFIERFSALRGELINLQGKIVTRVNEEMLQSV